MSEDDYIDPSKRSPKELILKLLDEMEALRNKVNKHMDDDSKEIRGEMQDMKVKLAVLQAKAAAWGTIGGSIFSAVISYIMK